MRLLLAEDEPALANWLVQALRQSDFQVDWVNDGRLVAPSLKASRYDALILDLGLPGRDGHDVLDGLRDAATDAVLFTHGYCSIFGETMRCSS